MRIPLFAVLLTLSACSQPGSEASRSTTDLNIPTSSCEAAKNSVCAFFNAPLILLTNPIKLFLQKEVFYPTAKDLKFVDSTHQEWIAPKGTLTDGASIPRMFIPIIGAPTSREFINAAAIHDAYCGAGNNKLPQYHADTWQNVHRMFYDALRVGGTSAKKAKVMYAAVYLGGPRWNGKTTTQVTKSRNAPTNFQMSTKSSLYPQRSRNGKSLTSQGVSISQLRNELQNTIDFIQTENPSIAELEHHLIKREAVLVRQVELDDEDVNHGEEGY